MAQIKGSSSELRARAVALKYNIELRAQNSWPTYATYKEDKELRIATNGKQSMVELDQ